MAKKIDIAGQLNSAAADNKLADASQIYDSKKGKFQEKFNEDIENKVESYKQELELDVNNAVANLIGGASETFDTLKEFEDWINNNESGAAAIAKQTNENKTAISDLQANTGISEYPAFDPAVTYAVGDVVKYEGRLYRFTAEHAAGEWIGTDVEKWSERKERNKIPVELYDEGFYDLSGDKISPSVSPLENEQFMCKKLVVYKGDIVYITCPAYSSSRARAYAVTDTDGVIIEKAEDSTRLNNYRIDIDTDGYLFVDIPRNILYSFDVYIKTDNEIIKRKINEGVLAIGRNKIGAIIADSNNLYNICDTDGIQIREAWRYYDGKLSIVVANESYKRSGYIEVPQQNIEEGFTVYSIISFVNLGYYPILFIDENLDVISAYNIEGDDGLPKVIQEVHISAEEIPSETKYIVFNASSQGKEYNTSFSYLRKGIRDLKGECSYLRKGLQEEETRAKTIEEDLEFKVLKVTSELSEIVSPDGVIPEAWIDNKGVVAKGNTAYEINYYNIADEGVYLVKGTTTQYQIQTIIGKFDSVDDIAIGNSCDVIKVATSVSESVDFCFSIKSPCVIAIPTAENKLELYRLGKLKNIEKAITNIEEELANIVEDNSNPTAYKGDEFTLFNKIVCIGDSTTQGVFNHSGGFIVISKYSYPTYLQKLTGCEVVNKGISSQTTKQWYDIEGEKDYSGYDAAIIQLGINDVGDRVTSEETAEYLDLIIEKLKRENNSIKIFVATITSLYSYGNNRYDTINEVIRNSVVNKESCYLVDLSRYSEAGKHSYNKNGHGTALGYLQTAKDYIAYISYIIHNNPLDFKFQQFANSDLVE